VPTPASRFLVTVAFILMSACGSGPTGPSSTGYDGEWSGTTSQGSPIAFTISSAEKLTKITVGDNFSGCTGSSSLSPNVALERPPVPVPGALLDYESAPPGTPNRMLFHFLFTSSTDAHGMVTFVDFTGCGTVTGTWTATKR
jgi:hypothetical protein